MCDQTEILYLDGDVVWVKLGSCWWPGEVVGPDKLPSDVLPSFKKPPIAVVKFFLEDSYEYVKNINAIYKYNCSRKDEFIKKGLDMYRSKRGNMEKFPEDVIRAETAVGGDIEILTRDEFQEVKKASYKELFGQQKTPVSAGKKAKGRPTAVSKVSTPIRKIVKQKTDYKVHILPQKSTSTNQIEAAEKSSQPNAIETPSTSTNNEERLQSEDNLNSEQPQPEPSTPTTIKPSTPSVSSTGIYSCHACSFNTTRMNVLILHNKTHSVTFMPYTPSPVRKKPISKTPKSTPTTSKTPKQRRPRKEKNNLDGKKTQGEKRVAEESAAAIKKIKTDEEIKSSLLADWDDGDDESSDEAPISQVISCSPKVPAAAESPGIPIPAELPSDQHLADSIIDKKSDNASGEKPESSSDSKYEFCEDEPDWPLETDAGRKIPRVKNPSSRKDAKSSSIDDEEVAREVAELLNKATVPELPSIPEPLKIEENFPELSVVKSPDKNVEKQLDGAMSIDKPPVEDPPPNKAIFKTKTFFRSRHSRSQDAIGKYVAEQLNAAERLDISECELNGLDVASSPESRDSPPIETVKVPRMAPKIQLKRMKAEAAQKAKIDEKIFEMFNTNITSDHIKQSAEEKTDPYKSTSRSNEVLYPPQEIKPINKECRKGESRIAEIELTNNIYAHSIKTNTVVDNVTKSPYNDLENITLKTYQPVTRYKEYPSKFGKLHSLEKDVPLPVVVQKTAIPEIQETKIPEQIQETEISEAIATLPEDQVLAKTGEVQETEIHEQLREADVPMDIQEAETPVDEPEAEIPGDSREPVITEEVKEPDISQEVHGPEISGWTQGTEQSVELQETTIPEPQSSELIEETVLEEAVETNLSESGIQTQPSEVIVGVSEMTLPVSASYEQIVRPSMSESTVSAVDALLSVSRESDRVTRIISNDLPEDLFEDEVKDSPTNESINGNIGKTNGISFSYDNEQEKFNEQTTVNTVNGMECDNEDSVKCTSSISEENNVDKQPEIVHSEHQTFYEDNQFNTEVTETVLSESTIETDDNEYVEPDTNVKFMSPENEISFMDNVTKASGENSIDSEPSESDLQIAEALINLPSVAIQNNMVDHTETVNIPMSTETEPFEEVVSTTEFETETVVRTHEDTTSISKSLLTVSNNDNINLRFETDKEKDDNFNAAQSLVQMSESIDHKINITKNTPHIKNKILNEPVFIRNKNGLDVTKSVEQNVASLSSENKREIAEMKPAKVDTSNSKLLKILEEPYSPRPSPVKTAPKHIIVPGKEKILNFEITKTSPAKSPLQSTTPKQKIIIRRANPPGLKKNIIAEASGTTDQILITRSEVSSDGAVQKYTINTPPEPTSDGNTILIQQKYRKIAKAPAKLHKIKPKNSLVTNLNEPKIAAPTIDPMFDINSMPVVLSDEILTPESIEKMPIVMTDGNIIANTEHPPKLIKTKPIEKEKVTVISSASKPDMKTLVMNPITQSNKVTSPNILSKSGKMRGANAMLVIDKTTGKQKFIMTKNETNTKETKPPQTLLQPIPQRQESNSNKADKFIILPGNSPRPGKAQKIVIDPQTGKAHVLVSKGPEMPVADNKPVSAKLIPSSSDANSPGNTVMIITNAQGTQSRIVLTPEHEKILFPNKQTNSSHLKTLTQRISSNAAVAQKTSVTSAPVKMQPKIVPKQKSAIITSKGQLIVGGRVTTTTQSIAPMPEIRPAPKKIVTSEPKKIVQKPAGEPLIFLQQKSGTVMQLTAAQFEHLQRTGQIVQKPPPAPTENKIVIQKSITIPAAETVASPAPRQRVRKAASETITQAKKVRREIVITSAPSPSAPAPPPHAAALPTLAPLSSAPPVPAAACTVAVCTSDALSELDNIEEIIPSTAISRGLPAPAAAAPPAPPAPPAPAAPPAPPAPAPAASAPIADGQLLAVPGEHFGDAPGFYFLCLQENGTLTPIDNRPLVLENNQLVPLEAAPQPERRDAPEPAPQPERRDILEAALANSDVFQEPEAPFRELNASVSAHCRVSETSSTLHQPIMSPAEQPPGSRGAAGDAALAAVLGAPAVPTSLELPITVTDPRIAPRARTDDAAGMSMPLLTDDAPAGWPDDAL